MTAGAHRRTNDGRPGLTAEFFRRRDAVRGGSVLGAFTDPEAFAAAVFAELGPAKSKAVAWALHALVRDDAA